MFFNSSDNDPYGDLRRQEDYQRQKELDFAKGFGNLFYRYIVYSLLWFMSTSTIALILTFEFGVNQAIATIIGMIVSFFIFKITYVKLYPFKSLVTVIFVFTLSAIAFSGEFLRNIYTLFKGIASLHSPKNSKEF